MLSVDFADGYPPSDLTDMGVLEALQVRETEVTRFTAARHRDDWETLPAFADAAQQEGGGYVEEAAYVDV